MATTRSDLARNDEWDVLATVLNRYGIRHVAPRNARRQPLLRPDELFRRLAATRSVRLQEAMIPLLLTHPELDEAAQAAIATLSGETRRRAMYRYVAACALQRMWRTRLAEALGPRRLIQEGYLDELGLPPLDRDYGRATLVALSNQEESISGYDAWAGYSSLMDLLLGEITSPAWGKCAARVRRTFAH